MGFEDADAVAEVLTFLRGHSAVRTLLGDPDPSVSGELEPPWPHLLVTEGTNGDLRRMVWEHEQEVELQLLSHPNGAPGKAALRATLLKVMAVALEMTDQDFSPTQVVINEVRPSGALQYDKLSTGQLSYTGSLTVVLHPPRVS